MYEEGVSDCYHPEYRALVDIVLNYDSDATQLGSDEDSATQYESEEWESVSDLYGTEKESDSSSYGSKPQFAPAHDGMRGRTTGCLRRLKQRSRRANRNPNFAGTLHPHFFIKTGVGIVFQ